MNNEILQPRGEYGHKSLEFTRESSDTLENHFALIFFWNESLRTSIALFYYYCVDHLRSRSGIGQSFGIYQCTKDFKKAMKYFGRVRCACVEYSSFNVVENRALGNESPEGRLFLRCDVIAYLLSILKRQIYFKRRSWAIKLLTAYRIIGTAFVVISVNASNTEFSWCFDTDDVGRMPRNISAPKYFFLYIKRKMRTNFVRTDRKQSVILFECEPVLSDIYEKENYKHWKVNKTDNFQVNSYQLMTIEQTTTKNNKKIIEAITAKENYINNCPKNKYTHPWRVQCSSVKKKTADCSNCEIYQVSVSKK